MTQLTHIRKGHPTKLEPMGFKYEWDLESFLVAFPEVIGDDAIISILGRQRATENGRIDLCCLGLLDNGKDLGFYIIELKRDEINKKAYNQLNGYIDDWKKNPEIGSLKNEFKKRIGKLELKNSKKYKNKEDINKDIEKLLKDPYGLLIAPRIDENLDFAPNNNIFGLEVNRYESNGEVFVFTEQFGFGPKPKRRQYCYKEFFDKVQKEFKERGGNKYKELIDNESSGSTNWKMFYYNDYYRNKDEERPKYGIEVIIDKEDRRIWVDLSDMRPKKRKREEREKTLRLLKDEIGNIKKMDGELKEVRIRGREDLNGYDNPILVGEYPWGKPTKDNYDLIEKVVNRLLQFNKVYEKLKKEKIL